MSNTYKHITPEKKLKQASLLYINAMELKRSALKKRFPKLTEEEIEDKTRRLLNNAAR